MTVDTAPRRSLNLAQVDSPGRSAVLRLDHPDQPPLILAGTAHSLWALVDGQRSVADVAAGAEVPEDVAVAFLDELGRVGLLSGD